MLQKTSLFILLIGLAGCANSGKQIGGSSSISVVESNQLPEPSKDDAFEKVRPYFVGPFDKLIIDVFGIEELSDQKIQIDASGRMSFPLAGTIDAAGKTPSEIEEELEQRLRQSYIKNPQVIVNLEETVSQVVTIDGQVREPGLYPVVGRMTLIRAVATAKGTAEYAKLDDVVVFRTVDGQRYAALYNLKAIRRGFYNDPEIFADDVIIVGESNARRLFQDLLRVVPILSGPIILALR